MKHNVVNLAWQVISMDRTIQQQAEEIEMLRDYKRLYEDEMRRGMEHSQKMMGGLLQLCMVPGVAAACEKHAKEGAA